MIDITYNIYQAWTLVCAGALLAVGMSTLRLHWNGEHNFQKYRIPVAWGLTISMPFVIMIILTKGFWFWV